MVLKKKRSVNVTTKHYVSFSSHDQESQLGEIYWKEAKYFYYLLLKRLSLALDELHWNNDYYINISDDLNEVISKIAKALETLEGRDDVYHKEQGKEFKIGQIDGFTGTSFRSFLLLYSSL